MLAPVPLNTICFRFNPENINDESRLNELNSALLDITNDSGQVFLTHTKLKDKFTIRYVIGQTNVEKRHIEKGWNLIKEMARNVV